jgi:hypothetical protein
MKNNRNIIEEINNEKIQKWIDLNGIKDKKKFNTTFPNENYVKIKNKWKYVWNPSLKKNKWSQYEDYLIFKHFMEFPGKWAEISNQMENRTRIAIRNRFKQSFKLKLLKKNYGSIQELVLNNSVIDLGKKIFKFVSIRKF